MNSSVVGLKKFQSTLQSQVCTKKGHGHCLVVCCPSGLLWISEFQWNKYNLEVCLVNWWGALKTTMPATSISQQNEHNSSPSQHVQCFTQPMLQKLNELGYKVLPHAPYSPDFSPATTSSSISTTFCRENTSTTSRRQRMLPRVHQILKSGFLHYRNKLICNLIGQKCVDCNSSYFD